MTMMQAKRDLFVLTPSIQVAPIYDNYKTWLEMSVLTLSIPVVLSYFSYKTQITRLMLRLIMTSPVKKP